MERARWTSHTHIHTHPNTHTPTQALYETAGLALPPPPSAAEATGSEKNEGDGSSSSSSSSSSGRLPIDAGTQADLRRGAEAAFDILAEQLVAAHKVSKQQGESVCVFRGPGRFI